MRQELIPEVGRIHIEAFAGYMNTRLGASYMEAFLTWFLKAERAIALVALDRERKIGSLHGKLVFSYKGKGSKEFTIGGIFVGRIKVGGDKDWDYE